MNRFKTILRYFFAYIAIAGLVTFSLFICQEASQTAMFGTWPAKDTHQWKLVLAGTDLMRRINKTEKIINWTIGWIQPLAFFAYRAHTHSIDYYIKTSETQVFAHEPQLMLDRFVEFDFRPRRIEHLIDGRYRAINGKLAVYVNASTTVDMMHISGYVKKENDFIIISKEK